MTQHSQGDLSIKSHLSRLTLILLGILVGIMLVVGLELSLRFFWHPVETPEHQLLVSSIDPFTQKADQYVTRASFLEAMRPSSFDVEKHPDTLRIFAFGGSATFGYPYPAEYSWPSVLQDALKNFYPHRKVEVINLGGTSYGTSRVLGLLRGILKYQPDLVIVYSGNNEFVEDSYREQIVKQREEELFIKSLYLARAYHHLMSGNTTKTRTETVSVEDGDSREFFFSPTVDGTVYQSTAEKHDDVLTRYRNNIHAMVDLCETNKIPIVLATVASNLSGWAPDKRDKLPELEQKQNFQRLTQLAEQALSRGDHAAAIATYKQAYDIFPDHAATNFALGSLLEARQDYRAALPYLVKARDYDPAPVRAISALNEVVRTVAAQNDIPLADVALRALKISPNGIPGDTLFVDYVHPTRLGSIHIAQAISETLLESGAFPPAGEARMESFWTAQLAESSKEPPMDVNIAFTWGQIYLRKGQLDKAEEMLRKAIDGGYTHPSATYYLADTLARKGIGQEAFTILEKSLSQHPDYLEPLSLLASLAADLGRTDVATASYRKILSNNLAQAEDMSAYTLLLLRQGSIAEAGQVLAQGLASFPNHCGLRSAEGRILEQQGRYADAETAYRKVIDVDTTCQAGWENLGILQMNQQRFTDAIRTFEKALEQPGAVAFHHLNLGFAYHHSGQNQSKAFKHFKEFSLLKPEMRSYIPSPYREQLSNAH